MSGDTSPRERGTSPRQRGTSPRQQGTNPRGPITRSEFEELSRNVRQVLRIVQRLEGMHRSSPGGVVDTDAGPFLPGSGTLGGSHVRGLTDEARAALDALDAQEGPT